MGLLSNGGVYDVAKAYSKRGISTICYSELISSLVTGYLVGLQEMAVE